MGIYRVHAPSMYSYSSKEAEQDGKARLTCRSFWKKCNDLYTYTPIIYIPTMSDRDNGLISFFDQDFDTQFPRRL